MRRRLGGLRTWAVVVPLALALAACGGAGEPSSGTAQAPSAPVSGDPLAPRPLAEPGKITLGISGRLESFANVLLAYQNGEFEKENLTVELNFVGPSESTLLVGQGKLDMALGSYTAGFFNIASANPGMRFVLPGVSQPEGSTQGYWYNKAVLNPSGGALTADMFKGQKVLTASGEASASSFQLYAWLKTLPGGAQLAPSDLTFESFDTTLTGQALQQGAAAAGQVNSPFDGPLVDDPCCVFIPEPIPYGQTVSGIFQGRAMEDRQAEGEAFVRAIVRTVRNDLQPGYKNNPATVTALAKVLELDEARLKSTPELYFDPDFQSYIAPALGAGQEFYRARGLLKYDTDLTEADVYDYSYLQALGISQKQN